MKHQAPTLVAALCSMSLSFAVHSLLTNAEPWFTALHFGGAAFNGLLCVRLMRIVDRP